MCSSYRSNQNPQTVKLSTPSSVHPALRLTSLGARYVSVLTPMRPNRPHIPSTIQFSKSKDTKRQTAPTSGPSATAYPDIPRQPPLSPSASPTAALRLSRTTRCLVFGEPLSRPTHNNPQEEKTRIVALFSYFPIYPQFPWLGAIIVQRVMTLRKIVTPLSKVADSDAPRPAPDFADRYARCG